MWVNGVYRAPSAAARTSRAPRPGAAFRVSEEREETTEAVATAGVAMPSLLLMQEAGSDALQDRDAKRHGAAVLDELRDLQLSLLGDGGPQLERLARLADRPIGAADPRLAGVLRAIQLRAGIELARRRPAASG
jgi:hypothetical protein